MRTAAILSISFLSIFALSACSDESEPSQEGSGQLVSPETQGPGLSGGFKVWHADFPGAPESPSLSPTAPNPWYDKSRRQALGKVIDNLTGTCTRDAWRLSREFFDRVEAEDLPLLIEHMDRAYQNPNDATVVANAVEAMGRAKNPIFADALLRALDHENEGVRGKAMESLVYSGTKDAVLRASNLFNQMTQRSQIFWLKAARLYLGEEAIEWYSALLQQPNYTPLHPTIINEVEAMPPAWAVRVFEPLWENPPPNMRPHIAGLRYANGDGVGEQILREYLVDGTVDEKLVSLNALAGHDISPFMDQLLALSNNENTELRSMLVQIFSEHPGDRIDATLETMLVLESVPAVRHMILGVLVEHGRRGHLEELIRTVESESGSKLSMAMNDLVAARDGAAVPSIDLRMQKVPVAERRKYLQAIGHIGRPESLVPLSRIFLAEEEFFPDSQRYAGLLIMNVRGAEGEVAAIWEALPEADYRRRGQLLGVLSSIAADREDPDFRASTFGRLRRILSDRDEIPQMRLLALNLLQRDIRIDDAMTIKRLLPDEEPAMRRALNNYLYEFF